MVLSAPGNTARTTGLFATLVALDVLAVGMCTLLSVVERVAVREGPTTASRYAVRRAARRTRRTP